MAFNFDIRYSEFIDKQSRRVSDTPPSPFSIFCIGGHPHSTIYKVDKIPLIQFTR